MKGKTFRIALVWHYNNKIISSILIKSATEADAINRAVTHFKPNHIQTLSVLR